MSVQTLDRSPAVSRRVADEHRRPLLRDLVVVVRDAVRAGRAVRSVQAPATRRDVALAFSRDLPR